MPHDVTFGGKTYRVETTPGGEVRVAGVEASLRVTPVDGSGSFLVDDGSRRWHVVVRATGNRREVFADGERYDLEVEAGGSRPATRAARKTHVESLTVPMPAKVVAILAAEGQAVRRGDVVITLEAMKMQLPLRAPRDGTVRSVSCREGDLVQPGVSLLEIV